MTRLYQALERVAKEREQTSRVIPFPSPRPLPHNNAIGHKMTEMYHFIRAQRAGDATGIIQFIGTHKGAGTSTLLRTFARVVSARLDKSVLIVDADPQASQATHFGGETVVRPVMTKRNTVRRVGKSSLFLIETRFNSDSRNIFLGLPHTKRQLVALRNHYDIVLVDSSPADDSSDSIALAKNADGVIIVLEAEKTRWQVAQTLKENIERQGTPILGTVLNQRQYHIPDSIYIRL